MMNNSLIFFNHKWYKRCGTNPVQTWYKQPHFYHFLLLCLDTINAYFKPFIRIYQL